MTKSRTYVPISTNIDSDLEAIHNVHCWFDCCRPLLDCRNVFLKKYTERLLNNWVNLRVMCLCKLNWQQAPPRFSLQTVLDWRIGLCIVDSPQLALRHRPRNAYCPNLSCPIMIMNHRPPKPLQSLLQPQQHGCFKYGLFPRHGCSSTVKTTSSCSTIVQQYNKWHLESTLNFPPI